MNKLALAAVLGLSVIPLWSAPAQAQQSRTNREVRECNRALQRADSRMAYRKEPRECRRELAKAQRKDKRDWRKYSGYD